MFYLGLLIGACIGGIVGFFVAALCQASGRADEMMEAAMQNKKEEK